MTGVGVDSECQVNVKREVDEDLVNHNVMHISKWLQYENRPERYNGATLYFTYSMVSFVHNFESG